MLEAIPQVTPYLMGGGSTLAAATGYGLAHRFGVGMSHWLADDAAVRANIRRAARIRRTWPNVANSLGLVHEDRNPTMADKWNGRPKAQTPRIRVPRIVRMDADRYGVTMYVRTVPGVGRRAFSNATEYMADEWRMRQVWSTPLDDEAEWGPGFVKLRMVYHNPLTITVEQDVPHRIQDLRAGVELGLSASGEPVVLPLAQQATITVMGASGFGKSMFTRNLVVKLAPSRHVQFLGANGKAGSGERGRTRGDYRALAPRYAHLVGGDPWEVNELLHGLVEEMYRRLDSMFDWWGVDEFWEHGPTEDIPFLLATFDECQEYLTTTERPSTKLGAIVADNVAQQRKLTKMGRAAGIATVLATQKGTDDAMPTDIRDVATAAIAFPVRSRAQETAALGEAINDYPEMSPRKILRDPFRGVGTILLDGAGGASGGFTQFKVPLTSPGLAAAVCEKTSAYVREVPGITIGRTRVPDTPAQAIELSRARAAKKQRDSGNPGATA
ncbi:FtsK/SpoIIIE domain-containing protein [Nocardia sp. CC201C]|uniref:FtsK/SpoIIIE domain-containing protein n=1 Tax=Nocardia sp. CC201C TaxID=3044575 RepID=UPI0024A9FB5B|nr:FtsK/SpoIIIE domain-containing protein [Nocardia sp. CC201C]